MGDPVLKMREGRPIAICWDWRNCSARRERGRDRGEKGRGGVETGYLPQAGADWCGLHVNVKTAASWALGRLGLALLALKKMLLVSVTRFSYLQMDGDHVSMHA
jgi:hypothetical protein